MKITIANFPNGFRSSAEGFYGWLRHYNLTPSWGQKDGDIQLEASEVTCFQKMAEANPARFGNKRTLFELVQLNQVPFSNHETDLYIPDNELTRALLDCYEFKSNATRFQNQVEGGTWIDIPFAFIPEWDRKLGRRPKA